MKILLFYILCLIPIMGNAQQCLCSEYETKVYEINNQPLNKAYLVGVDTLGQFLKKEVILYSDIDHCKLLGKVDRQKASVLGYFFFDVQGRVRKTIEVFPDGGDLSKIVYYDENGNMIYTIYSLGDEGYDKAYSCDGEIHSILKYPKEKNYGSKLQSYLSTTVENLAKDSKVYLLQPPDCSTVTFTKIRSGDFAFLTTESVYDSPEGNKLTTSKESFIPGFGALIKVESIKKGWCEIGRFTFDKPFGYVRIEDLELFP